MDYFEDSFGYDSVGAYPYTEINQPTMASRPVGPRRSLEAAVIHDINTRYPPQYYPSGISQPDAYSPAGLAQYQRLHGITRNIEQHELLKPQYTGYDAGYQTQFGFPYGAPGRRPAEPPVLFGPCSHGGGCTGQAPSRCSQGNCSAPSSGIEGFIGGPLSTKDVMIWILIIVLVILVATGGCKCGGAINHQGRPSSVT